jgi:hypothetical protein
LVRGKAERAAGVFNRLSRAKCCAEQRQIVVVEQSAKRLANWNDTLFRNLGRLW